MVSLLTDKASSKVVATMTNEGLPVLQKLDYEPPAIPMDVTALAPADLMELFGKSTAYESFYAAQTACAEIDVAYMKKQLKRKEAELKISYKEDQPELKSTEISVKVSLNKDFQKLEDDLFLKESYLTLIKQMRDSAKGFTSVLSREITRRSSNPFQNSRAARAVP